MSNNDFSKEFFQQSWGPEGYYEEFNYGVGFNEVVQRCIVPFFNLNHNALEIGSGGGAFTKKLIKGFRHVTAIDVIKMPEQFDKYSKDKFSYVELDDRIYLTFQEPGSIDFAFSYNCFCHLSNMAIECYILSIQRALKPGSPFIFMLANYHHSRNQPYCESAELGDLLPFGHFCQDERTLPLVIGEGWEVVSENMIPEHRDIIVHLKKI